jgi:myo-inositol-1(or 4)-monophosphatase
MTYYPLELATGEMATARQAARAASRVAMRYFRKGLAGRAKDAEANFNQVSDADIAAEKEIIATIERQHPRHAVMAEESHVELHGAGVATCAEHLWIVDPIDGTNNFLHGLPQFAISIAYYRAGKPLCGVICNPATGEWFEAAAGQGAWRNGKRVRVAAYDALDQALVGVGFYYDRGAMMEATLATIGDLFRARIHGIRRFGAAALDLANVGVGSFGAFFEFELHPWDFAAGRLFIEEAGGKVTTCTGGELPLAKTSVLATNGKLHEALLNTIGKHACGLEK